MSTQDLGQYSSAVRQNGVRLNSNEPLVAAGTNTLSGATTLSGAAVLSGGVTASGSSSIDFSGSTGTFKTSTGAVTIGTGAVTVSGAFSATSTAAFTNAPTGPQISATANSATVGATVVLTAADSGKTFINVSTSGSPSWTLPAAASGLKYTFVCGNTTAGFTVTAAGTIHAKTNAAGTAVSGTTLTNTQATAVVGDTITLVSDGTAWWMTAQSGIFTAA